MGPNVGMCWENDLLKRGYSWDEIRPEEFKKEEQKKPAKKNRKGKNNGN